MVCHTTRYKPEILTGITKILGIGKFGEFATLTLEEATANLLHEADPGRASYAKEEIIAEYRDRQVAAVLRTYPPTTPGKRLMKGTATYLISPEKEMGIDIKEIEKSARERYKVRNSRNKKVA